MYVRGRQRNLAMYSKEITKSEAWALSSTKPDTKNEGNR